MSSKQTMRKLTALVAASLLSVAACSDSATGPNGGNNGGDGLAAPSNVIVDGQGTSVLVGWDPVQGATQYRVELSTGGATAETQTLATTTARFDGLSATTSYSAQVFALANGAEVGSSQFQVQTGQQGVAVIDQDVLFDQTWTEDNTYVLDGPVFVGADCGIDGSASGCDEVTLTIEPGVTVVGKRDPTAAAVRGSFLVVSRGSELIADANNPDFGGSGQCEKPAAEDVIVFTSDQPRGQRARSDWGGLVLNGAAPLNTGAEAEGEGDSGLFGGNDEQDSSGILRGIRVEYAGDDVTAADQLNGIAFQGVGAGTTVCYVQVHYNLDDGTEPFGGTVSMDHVVTTGIGDDSFDGTDGWRGFMQFAVAQQRGDDADQGFEFSNNGDDPGASPHSSAVVANVTLIGAGQSLGSGEIAAQGSESDIGVLFREGSNFRIFNVIATGFGDSGFDVEGAVTAQNADNRLGGGSDPASTLRLESSILWANNDAGGGDANFADASGDGYTQQENKTFFNTGAYNNMLADPGLPASAFSIGSMNNPPSVIPAAMPAGYTAFDASGLNGGGGLVMPGDGRQLVATDYAGAVEPGTALQDAWYTGWTVWAVAGDDSRPNQDGQ